MKIKEKYIGKTTVYLPNKENIFITNGLSDEQLEKIFAQKGNEFLFEDIEKGTNTDKSKTAAELIEEIKVIKDSKELEKLMDNEIEGKNRKVVLTAIEKQINSLD